MCAARQTEECASTVNICGNIQQAGDSEGQQLVRCCGSKWLGEDCSNQCMQEAFVFFASADVLRMFNTLITTPDLYRVCFQVLIFKK